MRKELIAEFINKVVSGDATAKDTFAAYCNSKAKSLSDGSAKAAVFESFKQNLLEYGRGTEAPVTMEGDFVVVNGKRVGRVQTDLSDFDSGINFTSAEGDFSKEFNTAEDLFAFIAQRYLGEV